MTASLSNVAIEQFPDIFTNEYEQTERKLPPTIQNDRGVIGDAWHRSVIGRFILNDRGAYQSDIPPADVPHTDVVGTFLNKITNLPTDSFQQGEVKANERADLARRSAFAVARAEDQTIIDQWETDALITKQIVDGGTNLTVEKIREASFQLDLDNVSMQNRFFTCHVNQKKSLLSETETTSSDFNTVRTLVNGEIDSFYGFKFIWFGNIDEGGLPLNANIRTCFAYHMDSTVAAYGDIMGFSNPDVEVVWDHRSQSHLVIPKLRMGAKVILGEGIVKVECDETV